MAWKPGEMQRARLIHGPERLKSDTYRLHIPKEGDKDGKMIDVPGWMVGDPEMLRLMTKAADVIRERLLDGERPETPTTWLNQGRFEDG